jgi:hypothetical protein
LVAWSCLLVVASTAAYGLQLTVAGMVPSAAADTPATSVISTRSVLIVAIDPVTGARAQVECDAPANTFASEVVLVDGDDFPNVVRACEVSNAARS